MSNESNANGNTGYDFSGDYPGPPSANVSEGWHLAKVVWGGVKERNDGSGQYLKVDFEIVEPGWENVLVPALLNYYPNGGMDKKFWYLCQAAGLKSNYGADLDSVLADLFGRQVMIDVRIIEKEDGSTFSKAVAFVNAAEFKPID